MRLKHVLRGGMLAVALLPLFAAASGCCCSGLNKGIQVEADKVKKQNDLKLIGLAYLSCNDEKRKGPANAEELKPYMVGSEDVYQAIKSGQYVVIWNVSIAEAGKNQGGTSNVVLGYESTAPATGGAVLMADGTARDDRRGIQQGHQGQAEGAVTAAVPLAHRGDQP